MPSTTRTLNNAGNITYIFNNLALLRAKMVSRARVDADDLDSMREMYNSFIGHTHSYYDLAFSAFGNRNPYPTTGDNRNAETLQTRGAPVINDVVSGGPSGYRTVTDKVKNIVNQFRTWCYAHYHRVDDRILD